MALMYNVSVYIPRCAAVALNNNKQNSPRNPRAVLFLSLKFEQFHLFSD